MKKGFMVIGTILLSLSIFWLGFGYRKGEEPNTYYQVYLDGELIGTISSKKKLEKYIDAQNEYIKNKYNVDTVYSPNGLEIEKVISYNEKLNTIEEVYETIQEKKSFTIKGYQMTIKDEETSNSFYAIKEEIFAKALEETIQTFVGKNTYQKYVDGTQEPIKETGTVLENIYIENDKTIKEVYIATDEKIYTDTNELTQYLLFGENMEHKYYTIQEGDNIEKVAFKNQISVEEFLLSNTEFTNEKNLLFPGQKVIIAQTNPQIKVVTEEYIVEDITNRYKTIEQYDANRPLGDDIITQVGQNGLERVTQDIKRINGTIVYVNTQSKIELQPTVNQVVIIGQKVIPHIGSLKVWAWPTNSGWTISSGYAYRINPISGQRELHDGIDIAGTGYGSPVYAANHGTVMVASYNDINGYYIMINHNNGYYTMYAHMSKLLAKQGQIVARGDEIGKIGSTGWSTGPHLHFGIYYQKPYTGYTINPFTFY